MVPLWVGAGHRMGESTSAPTHTHEFLEIPFLGLLLFHFLSLPKGHLKFHSPLGYILNVPNTRCEMSNSHISLLVISKPLNFGNVFSSPAESLSFFCSFQSLGSQKGRMCLRKIKSPLPALSTSDINNDYDNMYHGL